MLGGDVRPLEADLVRFGRTVPVAASLQAEILVLRHQLNVLRRKSPGRIAFSGVDRMVFAGLYALAPSVADALKIVKPDTVIRWHRAGFRSYWRWKSRSHGGRPGIAAEIRQLIRQMSIANPLWGAPRIHGELLKLGIEVGQTTVAKYMAKRRRPPSQGWKTFLYNHADGIASMDLFVVPTISFRLLYGVLVLQHARRELLWLAVTTHPTAEWIARQFTEAFGWRDAPRYVVRDRDSVYGSDFVRRIRAMGIRDRPISARSPWQNGYAERTKRGSSPEAWIEWARQQAAIAWGIDPTPKMPPQPVDDHNSVVEAYDRIMHGQRKKAVLCDWCAEEIKEASRTTDGEYVYHESCYPIMLSSGHRPQAAAPSRIDESAEDAEPL
jgi:transposase InsO family protein